ncbi:MAG: translation initiation factor IF-2 [Syntrophaceae bacterium]|nr:translation initiation factor IF-2 [Syntrophaceae bacterium]
MTILTVDDLARDLKVKNEDLLKELVTMGYEVDGPESSLVTDDPAALRTHLVSALPQREIVEKRIRATVIRRRTKNAPVQEFQEESTMSPETVATEFEEPYETTESLLEAAKLTPTFEVPETKKTQHKTKRHEPARIIEMAPSKPPQSSAVVAPIPGEASAPQRHAAMTVQQQARGAVSQSPKLERESAPTSLKHEPSGKELPVEIEKGGQRIETHEALKIDESEPATRSVTSVEEQREIDDRAAKKRKKKDKRIQPAQIIGKVELKKEPPQRAPERPSPRPQFVEPSRSRPAGPPTGPRPRGPEPSARPTVRPEITTRQFVPEAPIDEKNRVKKRKDKKGRVIDERPEEDKAKAIHRRKEVVNVSDLYDDRHRGGRRGKAKKARLKKTEITVPKAIKRRLKLPETVTVSTLAHKMSVKTAEVIHHLLPLGVAAGMNEILDFDTATLVASEFGFETDTSRPSEQDLLPSKILDTEENLVSRPPVITVMGHVDHGKTSLLDRIRSTHVTDQEAGGITQHIGAYKVTVPRGELVFLDTPGHEAFTAMRARGAQVTDFVILVVAADDGVMDQTKEAINHAKAAGVPILVAINKIDKPEADRDRVLRELSEYNLIPEAWGGDTLFADVSAKTGQGVDEILDLILLQAEIMELRSNPNKRATGTIVEARLDKGKGPIATVLVKEGTLKLGDPFVAGMHFGKVRAMLDEEGKNVTEATPSTPVEIQGFSSVPDAGEILMVVEEEKLARQIGAQRIIKHREDEAASTSPASLEELIARMQTEEVKELNLILRGDVQGSVEALKEALLGIPSQEIKLKVIHGGVGAINESDIMLASASKAIVIGFNVRPTPKTTQLAEQEKVDVRLYTVIYDAIEAVRRAIEGMLTPIEKETVVGRAEVRQTFQVGKTGVIAGCHVVSGKIERSNQIRLLRDNVVVHQGKISSMKRFKDDVKEALEGYECGISIENYRDMKVGDVIEAFVVERESAKLV